MNRFGWLAIGVLSSMMVMGCSAGPEPAATSQAGEELRPIQSCGGPLSLACPKGTFCSTPAGTCPGPKQFGRCAPEPEVCTDLFRPVCGCDGQTYSNACFANAAGASVLHDGPCAVKQFCGGFAGIPCPGSGVCVDDPSDDCDPKNGGADCGGICLCRQTQLCRVGSHFDSSPAMCACVPDNGAPCGSVTCPTGQVCCNASCGICTAPGGACIQVVCQ